MVLQSFKNLETNYLDSCGGVFFFFADACFNDSPMRELFPFFWIINLYHGCSPMACEICLQDMCTDVCRWLLHEAKGVVVNALAQYDETILHVAGRMDHWEVIDMMQNPFGRALVEPSSQNSVRSFFVFQVLTDLCCFTFMCLLVLCFSL